jgi:hypothetical protein
MEVFRNAVKVFETLRKRVGGRHLDSNPSKTPKNKEKDRTYRENLIFLSNFRNPTAAQKIPKKEANDPSKAKPFHFARTEMGSYPFGFPNWIVEKYQT